MASTGEGQSTGSLECWENGNWYPDSPTSGRRAPVTLECVFFVQATDLWVVFLCMYKWKAGSPALGRVPRGIPFPRVPAYLTKLIPAEETGPFCRLCMALSSPISWEHLGEPGWPLTKPALQEMTMRLERENCHKEMGWPPRRELDLAKGCIIPGPGREQISHCNRLILLLVSSLAEPNQKRRARTPGDAFPRGQPARAWSRVEMGKEWIWGNREETPSTGVNAKSAFWPVHTGMVVVLYQTVWESEMRGVVP